MFNNNINNNNVNENYDELQQPIDTITFQDDLEGTMINISVNRNLTVEEPLKLYFKKININYSFNNSNIYFVYNGKKLELNDKTKIDQFMNFRPRIYVIHSGSLLGGP